MKDKILKIAGVKSEAAFYKKFPTEAAFMKAHGKELKKAKMGEIISGGNGPRANYAPIDYAKLYDEAEYNATGSNQEIRDKQATLAAQQQAAQSKGGDSGGGGDIMGSLSSILGGMGGGEGGGGGEGMMAALGGMARYGKHIPRAQTGTPGGYSFDPSLPQLNSFGGGTTPTLQGQINVGGGGTAASTAGAVGQQQQPAGGGVMDMIAKNAGPVGKIIGGFQKLKEEKKAVKRAEQTAKVSDVVADAAESRPEEIKRKYSRPEDALVQPGQLGSPNGVGTNFLSAEYGTSIGGNDTEVQNTFAPNDIYTDGGYEPLEDSEIIKQYRRGGFVPRAQSGLEQFASSGMVDPAANIAGSIASGGMPNAGSDLGGDIGGTLGTVIGGPIGGALGKIGGKVIGGLLDKNPQRIKNFQNQAQDNAQRAATQGLAQGIQSQNANVMREGGLVQYEEGGYMNPNYNPQLITKFGDMDVTDMHNFASEGMDVLRAGGHVKNYRNPSERSLETYAMGGELKTTWGGHAEPISQNPYLPGTGQTVMFRGKSHEEGDGNGHTGIGVTYGKSSPDSYTDYAEYGTQEADADVEVERGEPATELNDENGEKSLVVYGNLKISKDAAKHIGDAKAVNMKYKNYINSKSKEEARQNKIIEKALEAIDSNEDDNTVMGKMNLTTNQAMLDGANMKLKQIADIKIKASQYQNAINETAEENGVDADSLAKGKIKIDKQNNEMAKFGKNLKKAQYGVEKDAPSYFTEYDEEDPFGLAAKLYDLQTLHPSDVKIPYDPNNMNSPKNLKEVILTSKKEKQAGPKSTASIKPTEKEEKKKKKLGIEDLMMMYNEVLPYIRPSDQEELDPSQLYPEMMAASMNQLDPVQAQLFNPQLDNTYDISLQDQLNANQADFNALQRQTGYNPEAQSMLAAQKYSANSKILGEQFRMNQANKAGTYAENRKALDQAKLTNMGILDKQYERQETAKSKTKQQAIEIAKSMTDKVAQHKLENRKLGIMENMYKYRFDEKGRAANMNPLAMFDIDGSGDGATTELEAYEKAMDLVDDYKDKRKAARKTKTTSRNGSIVKAIKNL